MYNQIMKMVLAPVYASFMPIFESLATSAIGGLLGGGGGGGQTTTATPTFVDVTGGGLFDTSFKDGQGTIALTPEMQAIQQQMLGTAQTGGAFGQQAGALGQGFLGQAGEFDPFAAAQTQFGRMEDILAPQRDQQRLAQESRLFSQGRLGSTGGAQQQQALEGAFAQQQQQGLYDALGQAQGIQGQQISQGLALGQMPGQQQTQSLQNLLAMQQSGQQQLMGGVVGGGTQSTSGPGLGQTLGSGLIEGSLPGIQQGIGGLFSSPQG